MEKYEYLKEMLGIVYVSNRKDDIVNNYSILLNEKKKLLDKIRNNLMLDECSITLEDWHLEILQLQSDKVIFDKNKKVIEYPKYYSQEELIIIKILKRITYTPEELKQEEMLKLIKFFKNRKLVEDILSSSGNGLILNKRALQKVMKLFDGYTTTTGKNIMIYESLCTKLSLTKKDDNLLEKKIA